MAYYRIVRDTFGGFEVQHWRWWWPFWVMPRTNTHPTVEMAEAFARAVAAEVVKDLGRL